MTILFVITAGVTLSNGIIILFIVLLTNGWKNFNIKYICSALLLLLTMLGIGFVLNSETLVSGPQSVIGWMDVSTPRYDVLVENFFGESIQLHSKNVLGDVLVRRPVIVKYTWGGQYAIEYVVILLLLIGIYYGRRSKLLWLNVACLLYSILLHFVIGFAIKEVYIMSAHWIYVIPMSVAFIFKRWSTKVLPIRVCIIILTSYLWVYNGYLLYNYLTWPLSYR